ncbi:MAG: DUF3995 domain-containing protein [Maricaulaceae bacterium]
MKILSLIISATLATIAIFHILWGFKIWVPIDDEGQLAKTVAGFPGVELMPSPAACFIVAFCLLIAIFITLAASYQMKLSRIPRKLLSFATLPLAAIFLLRGLITYTYGWAALTPEMPFREMDQLYYGPLCLFLGLGILTIGISSLRRLK